MRQLHGCSAVILSLVLTSGDKQIQTSVLPCQLKPMVRRAVKA